MKVRIETPDGESHEDHDLAGAPELYDAVWFGDGTTAVVSRRIWDLATDADVDLVIVTTEGTLR